MERRRGEAMRGRRRYAFEIAMRGRDGQWSVAVARSGFFSRSPKATARSIAERWIFEQAGQLRGGRLVILGRRCGPPRAFDATVRIRILHEYGARQLAAAYIGVDWRRVSTSNDHGPIAGRDNYLPPSNVLVGRSRG
jgi:hypothetical protein